MRVPSLQAGHGRLATAGASFSSGTEYQRFVLQFAAGVSMEVSVGMGPIVVVNTLGPSTLSQSCDGSVVFPATDRFPSGAPGGWRLKDAMGSSGGGYRTLRRVISS